MNNTEFEKRVIKAEQEIRDSKKWVKRLLYAVCFLIGMVITDMIIR